MPAELTPLSNIAALRMGETIIAESCSGNGIPIYSADTSTGPWNYSDHPRLRLKPGALVVGARGSIGFPRLPRDEEFSATQTTIVIEPQRSRVEPRFLLHALRQLDFTRVTAQQAIPMLTVGDLSVVAVPIPEMGEQRAIAAVLDTLDDAIQKTEQIIAKLKQVKQGLLHDLLTRGIDDNGELRDPERHPEQFQDSPLGRIPKGWRYARLQDVAEVRSGLAKNASRAVRDPVDVPYLRVANVQDGFLDLSDVATIRVGRDEVDRYRVLPGDVLMNEGGDLDKLGRGTVWRGQFDPCVHQNHVFVVRCGHELATDFLDAWTTTLAARRYFLVAGKQTTNLASINKTALGRLPLVVPRAIEQAAIVDTLDSLERRLRSETAALQKLSMTKAGLAEDLLTGRVRTTSLREVSA